MWRAAAHIAYIMRACGMTLRAANNARSAAARAQTWQRAPSGVSICIARGKIKARNAAKAAIKSNPSSRGK